MLRKNIKVPELLQSKVSKKDLEQPGLDFVVKSRGVEKVNLRHVLFAPLAAHRSLPLTQPALPGEHGAAYDDAAQGQIWGKIFTY